jgi:hypothetical protein
MLSRGWLFTVARLGRASKRSVEYLEGKSGVGLGLCACVVCRCLDLPLRSLIFLLVAVARGKILWLSWVMASFFGLVSRA